MANNLILIYVSKPIIYINELQFNEIHTVVSNLMNGYAFVLRDETNFLIHSMLKGNHINFE